MHFTESESILPHSQQPVTCPYHEPDENTRVGTLIVVTIY